MIPLPNRIRTAGNSPKKNTLIAVLISVLLLSACVGLYACRKRTEQPPVTPAADQSTAAPAPAAGTGGAAPAVAAGTAAVNAPAGAATPAPTAPVTGQTSPEAAALINEANAAIAQNNIIKARDTFKLAMGMPLNSADLAAVKSSMAKLSDIWLFSPNVLPGDTLCSTYKVKTGDKFINIAKNCKTDYEILMKINNIAKANLLRAGQNLKVINGPFRVVVNRSSYTLDLYLQNTYVRSFTVGLGRPGNETPTGLWEVTSDKQIKPTWTDPDTGRVYHGSDPDYPLGTRWIGLKGIEGAAKGRTGFALHGTNKPEELGQALSRGCIRLSNPDIELLYSMLAPYSSQVSVVD